MKGCRALSWRRLSVERLQGQGEKGNERLEQEELCLGASNLPKLGGSGCKATLGEGLHQPVPPKRLPWGSV